MRTAALATVLLTIPSLSMAQAHKTRDLAKGNTLYVVPYAHLDTQWRWAYPQVIREFIANTLHDNFALIERYPNYVFNFSGSRRYEMMKEYYPADYDRLRGYIKAGRWFPCGSSVDENDANVPSGEALIRQVLYGNQYFRREFGIASQEYMLPDCFGFPYALPSILVHCGVKGFSTQKLTWGSANGIPFKVGNWEGPDGRSIVSALDPGAYVGEVDEDLSQNTSWLARIQNTGRLSGAYVDYHYYGTGDRGGAPGQSSVDWVEKSIAGKGPITVVSSQADEMFRSLTPQQIAKLPKFKGELLLTEHSAGSITSQAYMKRWNRKNELLADAAERASVAAMWIGGASYPTKRLYDAWDLVLGSQMHDMLPGTSIPKAYEFCWNDELLALNQFAAVTEDAVGAVTASMDTRAQGVPIVVYNPLSIDREDVVEATIPTTANQVQVYGPNGVSVRTQVLGRTGKGLRVLFLAKVPSTGFATFDARSSRVQRAAKATQLADLSVRGNMLQNKRFRVTLNKAGDITSVFDKLNKREVLKAPARLSLHHHNPAHFPAWNMDWSDAQKPPRGFVEGPAKIRVVENGPVRVSIEVERETDGSKFVQQIRLSAGSAGERVEIVNKIDWQTKETALKATFPLATGNPKATYDLQLGAIERGNNDPSKYEVPQHQWIDLSKPDGSYGVGVLNDSKFGSDKPDNDTVRLTLIYTPGVRGGYADQATQDFGRHEIEYALAPHAGDWRKGDVAWQAKRLNQPLRAFVVPEHDGRIGKSLSLFSTDSKQVEIQAIKKAEDSDEVIVRLRELTGRPASGVRIRAAQGIVSAREVNGQEQPLGPAKVTGGALVTSVTGYSLRTFAVRLGQAPAKAVTPASQSVALSYDVDVASTDKAPADGSFDSAGRAFAAEQFPSTLSVAGIGFKFGSTANGARNALTAKGQTISLPAGFNRVYVLAASSSGDVPAQFTVGNMSTRVTVQDWSGYIGQWDNRLWTGDLGPNFTNYGAMAGLVPGYVKPAEVATYASHRHTPKGNTFYEYSYIFKYDFDVPAGAKSLKLPNDPRVKVFAVSVARAGHDTTYAAAPLFDTLDDQVASGRPSISPSSGTFSDAMSVTIRPPLYWRGGGLHYTTDGSTPTAASPIYRGPLLLSDPTTIKAVEIDSSGKAGAVVTATINVRDVVAPKVVSVTSPKVLGFVRVNFSEQVKAETAENPANYKFSSPVSVVNAKLSMDRRSVELTLDKPLPSRQTEQITIDGITDLSKSGNAIRSHTVEVAERGALLSESTFVPKTTKVLQVPNLPVKKGQPWTLNFFTKIDAQPEDRTIIAGFGRATDGRSGTGRYFTKFSRGINFWVSNRDVGTTVPLDLGKWQMLTATYDGAVLRVYKNGEQIGSREVELEDDTSRANIMPLDAWERKRMFGGEVRDFTIWDQDLSQAAIKRLWEAGNR